MKNLKLIIANNIVDLRKSKQWTQAELAEQLNYSDKAISKWERAESIPDIEILKQISDIFEVTVDYLLEEEHLDTTNQTIITTQEKRNRWIISLLATSLVWLIATIAFVSIGIYSEGVSKLWSIYAYALPANFIVLLVFNTIWGNRKRNFIIISCLVWTTLLTLYLALITYDVVLIFIIGIPAQIIILLWSRLRISKH